MSFLVRLCFTLQVNPNMTFKQLFCLMNYQVILQMDTLSKTPLGRYHTYVACLQSVSSNAQLGYFYLGILIPIYRIYKAVV